MKKHGRSILSLVVGVAMLAFALSLRVKDAPVSVELAELHAAAAPLLMALATGDTLTPQTLTPVTRLTPTFTQARGGGTTVLNFSARMIVLARKLSTVPDTVTVASNADPYVGASSGKKIVVPDSSVTHGIPVIFGIFNEAAFRRGGNTLQLAHSDTVGLTLGVVKIP